MGPGKGLISGEHYIRYYVFQMFGLRQAGQAWKCGLSVLDMLSSEGALAVYRCWRGDAKPGTSIGPNGQKPLTHSRWHRACKVELNACGKELTRGEGCQCFLGFAIASSHSLLGTSSGQRLILATSGAVVMLGHSRQPHGLTCTGQSLCRWEASQEAPALALAVGL